MQHSHSISSLASDGESCRVCREGPRPREPLYTPCKCRGVLGSFHQECLSQWLERTGKPRCEFCRYKFSFKNIYDKNTPSSLPKLVLAKRLVAHVGRRIYSWLRLAFGLYVWLFTLPWCVRIIWRLLFWMADGGWARDDTLSRTGDARQPSPAADEPIFFLSTSLILPLGQLLPSFSVIPVFPVFSTFFGLYDPVDPDQPTAFSNFPERQSLLSEVAFFNNLTNNPLFNQKVIDVAEGTIIVLFVCLSFLMVFLIREWVVQQMPIDEANFEVDQQDEDFLNFDFNAGRNSDHEEEEAAPIEPAEERPVSAAAGPEESDDGDDAASNGGISNSSLPLQYHTLDLTNPGNPRIIRNDANSQNQPSPASPRPTPEAARTLQHHEPEDSSNAGEGSSSRPTRSPEHNILSDLPATSLNTGRGKEDSPEKKDKTVEKSDSSDISLDISGTGHLDFGRPMSFMDVFDFLPLHCKDLLKNAKEDTSIQNLFESVSTELVLPFPNSKPNRDKAIAFLSIFAQYYFKVPQSSLHPLTSNELFWTPMEIDSYDSYETAIRAFFCRISKKEDGDLPTSLKTAESFRYLPPLVSIVESPKGFFLVTRYGYFSTETQTFVDDIDEFYRDIDLGVLPETGNAQGKRHFGDEINSRPLPPMERTPSSQDQEAEESSNQNQFDSDASVRIRRRQNSSARVNRTVELDNKGDHRGFIGLVTNWFWGDVEDPTGQHAAERENESGEEDDEDDADDIANDAAAEDVDVDEELDGVFEFLGFHGPVSDLIQNSIFALVLISAAILATVWFPYVWGKLVLLVVGGSSPFTIVKLPFEMAAAFADFVIDIVLVFTGFVGFCLLRVSRYILTPVSSIVAGQIADSAMLDQLTASTKSMFLTSTNRLLDIAGVVAVESDFLMLSMTSHAALKSMTGKVNSLFNSCLLAACSIGSGAASVADIQKAGIPSGMYEQASRLTSDIFQGTTAGLASLAKEIYQLFLLSPKRQPATGASVAKGIADLYNPSLAYWGIQDRVIAIIAGYIAITIAGSLYLRQARKKLFSSSPQAQNVEREICNAIRQAGSILKVVVIICIEMALFPLYCGILLDFALLPLFENASVASRIGYAMGSPWIAGITHWFVGTSYMFHFALFVSMCRKILRKGVLHFIRDPDDPTNNPIKDVLDRSVPSQLRKIMFSALVYGGMVLVCLGGVVWSLSIGPYPVFPLRSAFKASLLEAVFDLTIFGALTPIVLDRFKPHHQLNKMYEWWFQKSARFLRLSSFLMGGGSARDRRPSRLCWPTGDRQGVFPSKGRWVYAPSSDQVRLRKGEPVFKEMDAPASSYNPEQYQLVYIPPMFRSRVIAFVVLLWLYSVAACLMVSVVPLTIGRAALQLASGRDGHDINDMYSLVTGLYIAAAALFSAYWVRENWEKATASALAQLVRPSRLLSFCQRAASCVYVYTALLVVFPIVVTTLVELYVLLPVYRVLRPNEEHSIHIIQNWILGTLYARLLYRTSMSRRNMLSRVFSVIFEDGWARPRAKMATRSLILPLSLVLVVLAVTPSAIGFSINSLFMEEASEAARTSLHRLIYPLTAMIWAVIGIGAVSTSQMERWQSAVIDEMYVTGVQLQNFPEKERAVRA